MKRKKYSHYIVVYPKKKSDHTSFWFQDGKMTSSPDFSKNVSNSKGFRTLHKLISFMAFLDENFPETVVKLWTCPHGKKTIVEIPMGKNWREYFKNEKGE